MEEILSSIRRIITDDEKGEAQDAAPQAEQAGQAQPGDESDAEADNQIIDDIARVLSGGAPAAEVDEEEEILDLTSELGGLELVEEVEVVEEVVELVEEIELLKDVAPAPEFVAGAAAPIPPAPLSPPSEELAQEAAPPHMEAPQPPAPEPAPAPQPSASQEAASALERAIAALKVGQVPTSASPQAEPLQFQAAPQPGAMAHSNDFAVSLQQGHFLYILKTAGFDFVII